MATKYRMLKRTDVRTGESVYRIQRHEWLMGWLPVYRGTHVNDIAAWDRWREVTQTKPSTEQVVATAKV